MWKGEREVGEGREKEYVIKEAKDGEAEICCIVSFLLSSLFSFKGLCRVRGRTLWFISLLKERPWRRKREMRDGWRIRRRMKDVFGCLFFFNFMFLLIFILFILISVLRIFWFLFVRVLLFFKFCISCNSVLYSCTVDLPLLGLWLILAFLPFALEILCIFDFFSVFSFCVTLNSDVKKVLLDLRVAEKSVLASVLMKIGEWERVEEWEKEYENFENIY